MGKLNLIMQLDAMTRLAQGDTIIWPGRGCTFHWASDSQFIPSMVVHSMFSKGLVEFTTGPAGRVYTISEKGKRQFNGMA